MAPHPLTQENRRTRTSSARPESLAPSRKINQGKTRGCSVMSTVPLFSTGNHWPTAFSTLKQDKSDSTALFPKHEIGTEDGQINKRTGPAISTQAIHHIQNRCRLSRSSCVSFLFLKKKCGINKEKVTSLPFEKTTD